jgi:hypothetical protein
VVEGLKVRQRQADSCIVLARRPLA